MAENAGCNMSANDPALGMTALKVLQYKGPQVPTKQTNAEVGWEFEYICLSEYFLESC